MTFQSPTVVILLLTLFVSLPHFNNASFVSDACAKAANFDANINRDFCVASLQADPKSARANAQGLFLISMNLAIKNVTNTISHINYLLSKPAYAHLKSELSSCQGEYSDAKDGLLDAIKNIYSSSCVWSVTGAMTGMSTCQDESSDKSILGKQHADGFQLCAMALTFHNKDVFN